MKNWSKDSWKKKEIRQQPVYTEQDKKNLEQIDKELSSYPGIVDYNEIEQLKEKLKQVAKGEAFLLQGGDCAESFAAFSEEKIKSYFRTFLQMNAAIMTKTKKPVVKIGRIAGQFAKPRSSDTEIVNGVEYKSYRGDIINDIALDEEARKPDPERIRRAYFYSAATFNYLRTLATSGYASLENISKWNKDFLEICQEKHPEFEKIVKEIEGNLKFIEACDSNARSNNAIRQADFYCSHEALLLHYDAPMTKTHNGKNYCTSAHMLWIGDRTRKKDEAHVEYLRGIENPVGIKVGPKIDICELVEILDIINPKNEEGKIVLIVRMGVNLIEEKLPAILQEVKKSGKNVIWQIDPMHGNIIKSSNGYKTRRLDDIYGEVTKFIKIVKDNALHPGGVHLEMTGGNVTECLGGSQEIDDEDLTQRYRTHCDPRLNATQSLELIMMTMSNEN